MKKKVLKTLGIVSLSGAMAVSNVAVFAAEVPAEMIAGNVESSVPDPGVEANAESESSASENASEAADSQAAETSAASENASEAADLQAAESSATSDNVSEAASSQAAETSSAADEAASEVGIGYGAAEAVGDTAVTADMSEDVSENIGIPAEADMVVLAEQAVNTADIVVADAKKTADIAQEVYDDAVLAQENDSANNDSSDAKKALDLANQALADAKDAQLSAQNALEAAKENEKNKKDELKNAEALIAEKTNEVQAAQNDAVTAEETRQIAQTELEAANAELAAAQKAVDDAQKAYDAALAEAEKVQSEQSMYNQAVEDAEKEVQKAQADLDAANAGVQEAQNKVEIKQTAYDQAEKSSEEVNERLEKAQADLDAANKEKESAEAAAMAAQDAYDKAVETTSAAELSVQEKNAAVETAANELSVKKDGKNSAETALSEAEKNVKDAQAAVDAAQRAVDDAAVQYNQGSTGFFKELADANKSYSNSAQRAYDALVNQQIDSYRYTGTAPLVDGDGPEKRAKDIEEMFAATEIGVKGDATDLAKMKQSLDYIVTLNNKRLADENFPNSTAYLINSEVMAIAQLAANRISTYNFDHQTGLCLSGENIANGNQYKPEGNAIVTGCYDAEKVLYENGVREFHKIGHYTNIMSEYTTVVGLGTSVGATSSSDWCSMVFASNSPYYTKIDQTGNVSVEEYVSLFNTYYEKVAGAYNRVVEELNKAKEQLASFMKKQEDCQTAYSEAQTAVDKAQEDLNTAKTELDNANADLLKAQQDETTAKADLEKKKAAKEEAQKKYNSARTAYEEVKTEAENKKAKAQEASKELNAAKTDLQNKKADAEEASKILEDNKAVLAQAQKKADTAAAEAQSLVIKTKNDLDNAAAARDNKQLVQTAKKTAADEAEKENEAAIKRLSNAETELENANSAVEQKNIELSDAKTAIEEAQALLEDCAVKVALREKEKTAAEFRHYVEDLAGEHELWIAGLNEHVDYTGAKQLQDISVYYGKTLLVNGKDYTITYKNNTNAGEAKVIVTGKGVFKGKVEKSFTIDSAIIEDEDIDIPTIVETGKKIKPTVNVRVNGKKLVLGKDYIITYDKDVVAKGNTSYKVTIQGIGNYKDSPAIEKEFFVQPKGTVSITKAKLTGFSSSYYYDEAGSGPSSEKLSLTYKGKQLEEGVDYDVIVLNNKAVGTGTLIIRAKDTSSCGFAGEITKTFTIKGRSLSLGSITNVAKKGYYYTGSAFTAADSDSELSGNGSNSALSSPVIYTGRNGKGEVIPEDAYTLVYTNNIKAGTATITAVGRPEKGYTGKISMTFKIDKTALNGSTGANITVEMPNEGTVEMTKGGVKPAPKVVFHSNGKDIVLREGVDYKLSYANNKKAAEAVTDPSDPNYKKSPYVLITGLGNFSSSIRQSFTICDKDIGEISMTVSDKTYAAGKKETYYISKPKLFDSDGKVLTENRDYRLKYYNNDTGELLNSSKVLTEGTTTVKVVAEAIDGSSYKGVNEMVYTIRKKGELKDISKTKSVSIAVQSYTGDAVKPEPVLKGSDNMPLVLGTDYVIEAYYSNVKTGTAYILVRGIGKYSGYKLISYRITSVDLPLIWKGVFKDGRLV